MTRNGAQAGTGSPMAIKKNLSNSQLKKCSWTNVLELDKTSSSRQQREEGISKYLACVKCTVRNEFGCNAKLQINEERARCKSRDRKKRPQQDPRVRKKKPSILTS